MMDSPATDCGFICLGLTSAASRASDAKSHHSIATGGFNGRSMVAFSPDLR